MTRPTNAAEPSSAARGGRIERYESKNGRTSVTLLRREGSARIVRKLAAPRGSSLAGMSETLAALYEVTTLAELEKRVRGHNAARLRRALLREYDRLFAYRNLEEWNRLVRVCESLALVGWGESEPVEAVAQRWANGSWYTKLQSRAFEKIPGHGNSGTHGESEWAQRGSTFVLRDGKDVRDVGARTFASQRNLLPKNPLRLALGVANHQRSAGRFVETLVALRKRLDRELRPEKYGNGFGYVGLT